jgi:PPK2 family polyphosphate:nucleotide phosphotransferase
MKHLAAELIAEPGKRFRIDRIDPDDTHGIDREQAEEELGKDQERLLELQNLLYAESRRSLLVVLQGMDASGKDGTIRHVMSGLNPQGVTVTSFKVPEGEEKRHDYLWRVHRAVPEWGKIGIFNRSHYEDVLIVRVHKLVPEKVWSRRYRHIREFERMLSEEGVHILKFLLLIGKKEQEERFQARMQDRTKHWKFSTADTRERRYWDDYLAAYQDAVRECSTEEAPWYVIPANHKWFRNLAVAQILRDEMDRMKLKYPK